MLNISRHVPEVVIMDAYPLLYLAIYSGAGWNYLISSTRQKLY
jgi:hypothetical protein